MILLFGGTGETAELATALVQFNQPVLVSTATDVPLSVGNHPLIEPMRGRLDVAAMLALINDKKIRLVIDAGHPFATQLHETVAQVAGQTRVPCLHYRRLALNAPETEIRYANDHQEAAQIAASFDQPILLTTGSRNLSPYVKTSKNRDLPLYARVLPHTESMAACDRSGLAKDMCIFARGPFSVEQNRDLIRQLGIGVMVSKDSGTRGGVAEKLKAAQEEGVTVVMIRQPKPLRSKCRVFEEMAALLAEVEQVLANRD